jgi:hypothetical protein
MRRVTMRTRGWILLGVITALCISSNSAKRPACPPPDAQLGGLACKIKVKGPTAISVSAYAVQVFFVKVEDGVDMLAAPEPILSNFYRKKQVYLLNAEPGDYVAVGVFVEGDGNIPSSNVYFDAETIAATAVTVEPGKVAFMGDIVTKMKSGMKKADAAQDHYADLLGRGIKFGGGVSVNVTTGQTTGFMGIGHVTRAGSLRTIANDPEAERAFWTTAAEKTFAREPAWQAIARDQLTAVN